MERKESRPAMGDGGGGAVLLTKPALSRPPLVLPLPPRSDADASPGPMSLVSNFFTEHDPDSDCRSFSQLLAGAMASPPSKDKGAPACSAAPPSSAAGHVDRGTTSSAKFKCAPPSRIPIPRSPFLSLPHGLSPSTLLDSPMLLSNAQVEPSPTTGNFPLVPVKEESLAQESGSSFVFKPFAKLGTSSSQSTSLGSPGPIEISHQKLLAQIQAHAQAKAQIQAQTQAQAYGQVQVHAASGPSCDSSSIATSLPLQMASSSLSLSSAPAIATNCVAVPAQLKPQSQSETTQTIASSELVSQSREQNQRALPPISPVPVIERPSADGYNWRKYGQKQVKGSECPRSYYKCTHSNCPVKKKVERSHDGQVREIVYKGEHNHPKPQPTRRMAVVSHHYILDGGREVAFPAGRSGIKNETLDAKGNGSSQVLSGDPSGNVSDPSTSLKMHDTGNVSPDQSCGSSDDQGEDGSRPDDGDDNEPDTKRSKKDKNAKEVPVVPQPRTIREPRVVVQTTSDVDILDDGYRWRKYGQKVVKGNPYPRSYYKCTNLGCPVRKHVERASNDVKAVITTYEGKHNHDVPATRNSSHDAAGANSQVQTENSAASGSGVTNVVHGQQIGNQLSAFGRVSESRAEGGDSTNTGNGGVTESVPAIWSDGHYNGRNMETSTSSSVTLSMPSPMYPKSMVRSFGSGDTVTVSGIRPKEEH